MKTALLAIVILSGCASLPEGVQMTDEERTACAASGCAVFTEAELRVFAAEFFKRGYLAGRKSL